MLTQHGVAAAAVAAVVETGVDQANKHQCETGVVLECCFVLLSSCSQESLARDLSAATACPVWHLVAMAKARSNDAHAILTLARLRTNFGTFEKASRL